MYGLDVSHHQGVIDWAKVPRDRFSFVYIKATEGGDWRDPKFSDNWREARAHDFRVGAYHFFTLCRDGVSQAKNFVTVVPRQKNALPPVIDLEFFGNCAERPSRENFLVQLQDFSKKVEKQYGAKPVLYTTYEFYRLYLKDSFFSGYPLWIRNVFSSPDAEFSNWLIWQYADNARVPGIQGPVDLNTQKGRAK